MCKTAEKQFVVFLNKNILFLTLKRQLSQIVTHGFNHRISVVIINCVHFLFPMTETIGNICISHVYVQIVFLSNLTLLTLSFFLKSKWLNI
jgi:hypothetical protein